MKPFSLLLNEAVKSICRTDNNELMNGAIEQNVAASPSSKEEE